MAKKAMKQSNPSLMWPAPWTNGDRILLIAHHAKGLEALHLDDSHSTLLSRAGFQLVTGDGA